MSKQTVVHPYIGMLLGNEKELLVDATTCMDLTAIMLSEKSQPQHVTLYMIPLM